MGSIAVVIVGVIVVAVVPILAPSIINIAPKMKFCNDFFRAIFCIKYSFLILA